ncbi:MAG: Crp/Fnr family transcriptional regulator [Gammaproteobacteria bacterium]|nr:Crp/Fnr family transcriptional regulator [Gammaproteobacteria bacterium]
MSTKHSDVSIQALRQIEVFRSVDDDTLRSWRNEFEWHRYSANQQIVSQNEPSSDVHFVCGGLVRATIFAASGKEVTFQDLGPGEIFGELAAIDSKPRTTHVLALADSLVATMTARHFLRLLHNRPDVAIATLQRLSGLVRRLCDRVVEFSTLGVKNRIQAELLRLARANGVQNNRALIERLPTHAEIASRVSTHREAATRELNRLIKSKILQREGKSLVVTDVARLERMVEDVQDH